MYPEIKSTYLAAQFFGLPKLEVSAGPTMFTDPETHETERTWVKSFWLMTLRIYNTHTESLGYITISCVTTTTWKRGILFIPPMLDVSRDDLDNSLRLIKPIDLYNWDDIVENALQEVNLMPPENPNVIDETNNLLRWDFVCQFANPLCYGAFQIDDYPNKSPRLLKLGNSILQAIRYFGEQYRDNQAIHDYLAQCHLLE